MATAEVGNSAFGEDPSVAELEATAAGMLGKEAALFLPSGTMANQVALMVWTATVAADARAPEVIAEASSHIVAWESGGIARLSGAQTRTLTGDRGALDAAELRMAITGREAYPIQPVTAVICLENTHNASGGAVVPVGSLAAVKGVAEDHDVPVHLDGARVFNAAVASGQPVERICAQADSVMVSLSKGLCAPVGSILAGRQGFIEEAGRARMLLGGAMRQAGIVAAAGTLALETMVDRLAEDHENAQHLARGLSKIEGIELDPDTVETNLVYAEISGLDASPSELCQAVADQGVLLDPDAGPNQVRAVTHKDVSREDTDAAIAAVESFVDGR